MINEKFKIEVKALGGGRSHVFLKGTIDEDTEFDTLKKLNASVIINFKGVTSINSCGIRTWVNVMKDLQNTEVIYEECPPLIVRQMNMVPSFLSHATVSSVYVPYVCDDCESEKMVLMSADKFTGGTADVPQTVKCDSCKTGEMELDGNPKQYFAFTK